MVACNAPVIVTGPVTLIPVLPVTVNEPVITAAPTYGNVISGANDAEVANDEEVATEEVPNNEPVNTPVNEPVNDPVLI